MKIKNLLWVAVLAVLTMSACTSSRYHLTLHKADWTAPEKPEAKPLDRNSAAEGDLGVKNDISVLERETEPKEHISTSIVDKSVNRKTGSIHREDEDKGPQVQRSISHGHSEAFQDGAEQDGVLSNDVNRQPETEHISQRSQTSSDVNLILLVILAIILPPLAVFLFEEASTRFWITLILWLVGWGVGLALLGLELAALCALVAVVYALLIVLGVI